jgi:hypothetical protein
VFRIHSDKLSFFALAAASMAFLSFALKRTGTILPLASPFGNFGLPTFLGFVDGGIVLESLYDCGSHG